jgi:hypothetical protein
LGRFIAPGNLQHILKLVALVRAEPKPHVAEHPFPGRDHDSVVFRAHPNR